MHKDIVGTLVEAKRILTAIRAQENLVPDGALPGGEWTLIPLHIDASGELSKYEALLAAKMWRELARRYPKACFVLAPSGVDEDPRPLWEIAEVAQYVCWWAHCAGLENIEIADRLLGTGSALAQLGPEISIFNIRLMAACGVFGDATRQQAIKGLSSTRIH